MEPRHSRRWRRLIVLAAVTMLIAASCAADDSASDAADAAAAAANAAMAEASSAAADAADAMAEARATAADAATGIADAAAADAAAAAALAAAEAAQAAADLAQATAEGNVEAMAAAEAALADAQAAAEAALSEAAAAQAEADEARAAADAAREEAAAAQAEADAARAEAEAAAAGAAAAPGGPQRGGTLTFARFFETQNLDPAGVADNGSIFVRVQIYNTLVEADPDTIPNVGPGIADEWSSSPDGMTWTFHIRDNARFSNGEPVTAEDVQFSLERFADPTISVNIPSLGVGVESVDIIDDQTVQVNLDRPVGAFLENISVFPASIINKAAVEAEGDDHWLNPLGTGPFKVKEWVPGSHITLERNEYYWEEGKPYLDEIRFDYIPDDNARMLRMQGGDAHILEGVPWTQIPDLQDSEGFSIHVADIVRYEGVFLNHTIPPLDEIGVRQALNYATNKAAINEAVYGGVGEIANSMIPKALYHSDYDTLPAYFYDLERAQELMAASSMPDGFDLAYIYPSGSTAHEQLGTILQADWAKIGVNLTIEEVDTGTLFGDRFFTMEYESGVPLPKFTSDVVVPDEVALLFYDKAPENILAGFFTGWDIPDELERLTEEAAFTNDEAIRAELWPEVQRIAMEEAPWVTLFFLPTVHAVADGVEGFRVVPNGWWDMEDVWLSG
ncbi:MAG: ABC transporter substrate-binding protein [bacterium]|nr:ABC transporter substrate-binding protein [bacterium]MXV91520.1 ABC transporter substrate-binding protein [Acidimicrobiia bacterium]MYC45981.1 ABC transporter substrate-binding protein [Acidimicrobiia bacterium]